MSTEDYYCPLCGNKPFDSFVACRILDQPICADCDTAIQQFFVNVDELKTIPPQVERLSDYSGLPVKECAEIWHKERLVSSLLNLRDGINYFEQAGDLWDDGILKELLFIVDDTMELGKKIV